MFSKPSAHINLKHLQHNAEIAKQLAPNSKLLAVVKANAYGHGVHESVKALSIADGFAVARFDEAIELRRTETKKPLLILGGVYTNNELDSCLQHSINVVVHQAEQLDLLCQHNSTRQSKITVWLKIDTGMHRLGIAPEEFKSFYEKLGAQSFVQSIVAMTHFANAEEKNNAHTESQINQFNATLSFADKKLQRSLANSAGLLNWPSSHGDWMRPGLMLYGINPNPEQKLDLKPVMTLQAPIVSMRNVNVGEYVGYNLTWKATRESKIATIALGYGDGYPAQLKSNTPVLINGKRVPIVGRVSMDLITVDCTDLQNVKIGDSAIFWGEDSAGNILPVEEIAKQANTIPYDLITKISGRVKYNY